MILLSARKAKLSSTMSQPVKPSQLQAGARHQADGQNVQSSLMPAPVPIPAIFAIRFWQVMHQAEVGCVQ
jgi:hypothetical protein